MRSLTESAGRVSQRPRQETSRTATCFVAQPAKHAVKPVLELARAAQVAGHVRADANVGAGGGVEMKVRIKTGDAVKAVERNLMRRESAWRVPRGQVAVLALDSFELFENHRRIPEDSARPSRACSFRFPAFRDALPKPGQTRYSRPAERRPARRPGLSSACARNRQRLGD